MGPPCTAFANWSCLNRVLHHQSWLKTRKAGKQLAEFAAELAHLQLEGRRRFLIENPRGSELFKLPAFAALWATGKVYQIHFPRCALGLRVDGELILKWTTLWSSSTDLLRHFGGLRCTHKSHGVLMGSNKTKLAQVWPAQMCARIVQGILDIVRIRRRTQRRRYHHFLAATKLSCAGDEAHCHADSPTHGLSAKEEAFSYPRLKKYELGEIDCPGCVAKLLKCHPDHTRNTAPPLLCRVWEYRDGT